MFPSNGKHIKHKLFLVKGWALFKGQSETLSGQQRAIRALATAQLCPEYICSVNICIRRINGFAPDKRLELIWSAGIALKTMPGLHSLCKYVPGLHPKMSVQCKKHL